MMKNLLKPVKQEQKKQAQVSAAQRQSVKKEPDNSKEQQGEFLTLKFMRGLITIQINRLTPLSFLITLLFMAFVIFMMKYCSEALVTFLQTMTKIPLFIK
jgi:hypothetical protein